MDYFLQFWCEQHELFIINPGGGNLKAKLHGIVILSQENVSNSTILAITAPI